MKKYALFIGILFSHLVLQSHGGKETLKGPWEKEHVSFPMMNQEIRHSLEENDRQVALNKKHTKNTAVEAVNKKQWQKFKEVKTKIQNRLRIVDFALQAIPTGYVITQKAKAIKKTQENIIREIRTAPYAIQEVLPKQIQFVDDLQMTTRLLVGIVASYGAINQMEKAERQTLLNYALEEVERLNSDSFQMYMLIRFAKDKMELEQARLEYYKNRDKQLVGDILKNIKSL
ncbi:hypothetical protein [Ornithobacterium rhinotracheale]|uniref:hypothetical protein n=1 Tax=Ornithobacterium rhinotracheale TaxID=28251 RepID=UPI00403673A4